MRRHALAAVLAMMTAPLGALAQTAEPVALVLEISGPTTPTVAAFSELRGGTKLALGADTRLRFVHYKSCRVATIRGGELTLLPSGHLLRDSQVEADELRACPKRLVSGAQSGVAGGLVMRGAGAGEIRLPPQPTLMIAGARAGRFARVVLEGDGRRIALERTPGAPVWRYAGPLLPPGAYRLVAIAADGQRLVDQSVSVVAAGADPAEIAILRAD